MDDIVIDIEISEEQENIEIVENIESVQSAIKVYVAVDENKVIKEINSSIFLQDITDYIDIDEGYGDKYSHAQSQYLEKGLIDNKGRFNYKFDDVLAELTEEEKENLFPILPSQPTTEERLKMAEETILFLLMGGM